jgi:signal transduction histidine kinase
MRNCRPDRRAKRTRDDASVELYELRRAVSDMVAVTALPGIWLGRPPDALADSLSSVLFGSLSPTFLYVQLDLGWEQRTVEIVRTDRGRHDGDRAGVLGQVLAPWLHPTDSHTPTSIPNPLGEGTLRLIVTPIAHVETYGLLAAASARPNFPDEHDRLIARVAANEAAIALHGMRLSAERDRADAERAALLEREQAARAEVERAWRVAESEKAQLEAALRENIWLADQARGKAALEERQRLARELHDSVSQALYGIALNSAAAEAAQVAAPGELGRLLHELTSLAEAGLAEMRALIFELRPESLEREGLIAAIEKQAAAARARHGLNIQCTLGREPDVSLLVKEALYRIVQESVQNIAKHARAKFVAITLESADEALVLCVADNGHGFDPNGSFPGHLGLQSMRERAEAIDGSLTIESAPGSGTRIGVRVPLVGSGRGPD